MTTVRCERLQSVGDIVVFGKYAGNEIKVDGEDRLILKEDEVLGILEANQRKLTTHWSFKWLPKKLFLITKRRKKSLTELTHWRTLYGSHWGGRNVVIEKSGSTGCHQGWCYGRKRNRTRRQVREHGCSDEKEVASKTSDVAGDGTTTATVLAQGIFHAGSKLVAAGHSPMDLKRGIDAAVDAVVGNLHGQSREVTNNSEIAQVATISANGDTEIGDKIAAAMDRVGKEGVITVEENKGLDTTLDVVEGMQFDRGYLSPYFVTDADRMEVVLENPYILIHEKKISQMRDMIKLLERVVELGRPILVLAEDVEGEALAALVVNRLRNTLQCAAVKAPGFGDRRKRQLEDIAALTGGRMIAEELGVKLENVTVDDLGEAQRVVITDHTTIIDGAGNEADIQARISQIQNQIANTTSDYDRENSRTSCETAGGVAVVKVGAATEVEMKEKKARVEDALHATKAVEEGILPGGGVA